MDLAARNVLLGIGNNVKVGDFGMAREMASDGDYVILREKVRPAPSHRHLVKSRVLVGVRVHPTSS